MEQTWAAVWFQAGFSENLKKTRRNIWKFEKAFYKWKRWETANDKAIDGEFEG